MRFFVEVTPIGKTDTQKYCVDAESWQKALQAARAMRKEDGSISGFSIELADDGYRAVDPAARIRYMVKKAPADASITTPSTAPPPVKASVPPPAHAAAAPAAPAHAPASPAASASPSPPAHPISVPPPRAEDNRKMGGKTVSFASSGAALLASNATAQAPSVPRASPSKPSQARAPAQAAPAAAPGLVTERKKPDSIRPIPAAAPAQPAAPIRQEPPATPPASARAGAPIVVLYRKEQAPTAASPITYREEVFAAPPGTSEEHAESILRAEFRLVTSALSSAPAGKYVNLAVFDRVFEGRPPAPPLAILSWKDWKPGDPTITFPRRQREKLSSATQPSNLGNTAQIAQAQAAHAVAQVASHPPAHPVAPAPVQAAPAAAHARPASSEARSVPPSTPPPRARIEPESDTVVVAPDYAQILDTPGEMPAMKAPPAPAVAAPVQPAPVQQGMQTPAPGAAALSQSGSTGSFRRARKPTPAAADGTRIRVRGDELIALLFEEMHDLSFMADALEGAAFCLWVVLDKLPSKAAFVHFYDLEKREFVVASVAGGVGAEHAARRNSPNDPWLAEAMRRRTVYVTADATSHEGTNVERFAAIGGARSVIVAPVMLGGRMLGAIEVVNPIDGNPFGDDDANAIQYMAEQFAEFVSSHGMVVDETRIRRAALNPPA